MTKRNGRFVKIDHELLHCQAWLALSLSSAVLLIEIWSRYNGRNNGRIAYSRRQACDRFGFGPARVVAAFAELQDKGFIVAVKRGSFHLGTGEHSGTSWRLTMEPCNATPPTRDYLSWKPRE